MSVNNFMGRMGNIVKTIFLIIAGTCLILEYKFGMNTAKFMSWFGGSLAVLFCAVIFGAISLTFPKQLFKSNSDSFFYNAGPFFAVFGVCLFLLNTIFSFGSFLNILTVAAGSFFLFYGSARIARYIKDKSDEKSNK
jgi:hypothetical protein